jgi:WD40 repeat protein/uncharacterized caspase-like protein
MKRILTVKSSRTDSEGRRTKKARAFRSSLFALIIILLQPCGVLSQESEKILRINPAGHKGQIRDMLFDNDGNIITASLDKTIKIWNGKEGYLEREIFGHIGPGLEGAIYCMALSPDNKYLAVGGWFGANSGTQSCGNIRLYDYKTGKILKILKMHVGAMAEMRFFPSSKHLISVDVFSIAYLWDVETGKYYTFPNFEGDITDIDVYDQYILTSHKSGVVNLYDIDQAKPIGVFKKFKADGKEASCVAIAPTGERIAVSGGGEVYLLDHELNVIKHILYSDDPIYELNFSPNGKRLVISSCGTTQKKQRIGVIQEIAGVVSELAVMDEHRSLVLSAGFMDNNTVVTAGGLDNEIAIWNLNGEPKPEPDYWITGAGHSVSSVSMKGTEIAFAFKKTSNNGMSKFTTAFDLVDRDIRILSKSDTFTYPVTTLNGMTLTTSSGDEVLYIKKGVTTLGQIKRTIHDGLSHVTYGFLGDSLVIAAGGYGFLEIYDLTGSLVTTCVGHEESVGGIGISDDNRYLISSGDDETIRLWKINEIGIKKIIYPALSIFISHHKEWVVWNEEGYFTSSKKGAGYVGYHLNQGKNKEAKFYPFEQFDIKFNRPDIIMQELGMVDQGIIDLYYSAYLKRLKRMGLTEAELSSDLNVPSVQIVSTTQTPGNIKMTISASDSSVALENIQVLLNDVPVFGSSGIAIEGNKLNHEQEVEFDLMNGKNKIQVSAFNAKGVESLRENMVVNHTATAAPAVYLVTIGVSNYKDKTYNLGYAAKDAEDLANLFSISPSFPNIRQKQLLNEEVTRANIMQVSEFLAPAERNDIVIFFIAGHGVLNKKLDYYYCTHDMDFLEPEKNGVAYAEFEQLFDQLKAIRKLLIMDTCHSGEVDKDDVEEVAFVATENPDITFRSGTTSTTIRETQGLVKTNEAVKEMFNDLRRGTGATVISSAGGVEFAMESDEWKNGLFTYCLLEGIKSKKADLDKNGEIMLSELQDYIGQKVAELSKGKQMPTSRFENLNLDYRVW